ncbi:palmitoyltransferase swf1 [Coemansia spiralis]|nr:palmitoyltransferase swf1 [Coemansia spiralis]
MGLYVAASAADPGTVTPANAAAACATFPYDQLLFFERDCKTCRLPKPARSKHCPACRCCVQMAEHHCIWLNNCVGLRNARWFLGFLATLAVVCIYGAYLVATVVLELRHTLGLAGPDARVWDSDLGRPVALSFRSSLLVVLNDRPLLAVLLVLLLVLAPAILFFACYQLRIVMLGYTGNEETKWLNIADAIEDGVVFAVRTADDPPREAFRVIEKEDQPDDPRPRPPLIPPAGMPKPAFPHPSAPTIAGPAEIGAPHDPRRHPPPQSLPADLDDDDICPICEDECTCGNARSSAAADDTTAPLFSQIINRHAPTAGRPRQSPEPPVLLAKKTKAKGPSVRAPRRPRKQQGRAPTDKSLLSRLVSAMGGGAGPLPTHDGSEGEEVLDDSALQAFGAGNGAFSNSSSSEDDTAFVSAAAEADCHAATAALAQAALIARPKKANAARRARAPKTASPPASTKPRPRVGRPSQAGAPGIAPPGPVDDGDVNIDDDEFINITDVTSDEGDGGAGLASETEFDLRPAALASHSEWSDSRIPDDDGEDEDIECEDAAYLLSMRQSGYSSSSSLSELDDGRMEVIRGGADSDSDLDSGVESDSESSAEGMPGSSRRRHRRAHRRRDRGRRARRSGAWGGSSDSADESDEELTFRAAQTENERALVEYCADDAGGEDALLEMHLDQLRAVRNVIQGAPLGHATASESDDEGDIVFTYHGHGSDDDDAASDDLVANWGAAVDSDTSMGEPGAEDGDPSDAHSTDSYDEFYTRSAFPDMGSDDYAAVAAAVAANGEGGRPYSAGLDLDSASLALGVALSMEQQGYSKADVAAVAAAAAAAAGDARNEYMSTTTITASMNANGEADPIDGIVSVKSTGGRSGPSRMATGTHTPYVTSDWRMAAAAAAVANAYLDGPMSPAMSYVLPRDLNEARTPGMPLPAVSSDTAGTAGLSAASSATMAPASVPPEDKDDRVGAPEPPRTMRALTSQLPNSSFYKPLSSISSSTRASGADTAATSAPATATYSVAGAPLVALAEVNAALAAFSECQSSESTPCATASAQPGAPKRKASHSELLPPPPLGGTGDKRVRRESQTYPPSSSLELSTLFELDCPPPANPTLVMGAGTPMRSRYDARGGGRATNDDEDGDDWLITMDQLVDTDALLVQSPPPSPVDGAGSASDISSGRPFASGGRRGSAAAAGTDMFARWDRIPVNIFRRSRALASNRRALAPHDDPLVGPSSLAMTAIKSSRQRRALVNSTLLTQHTLSAEAALRHHELKLALRAEHRGLRLHEQPPVAAAPGRRHPPAPPSTPPSGRARAVLGMASQAPTASPRALHRSSSQDAPPGGPRAKALDLSPRRRSRGRSPPLALRRVRAEHLRSRHRKLVSSGIVTDVGTPCDSPGPESDSSETTSAAAAAAAMAAAGDASDTGYAFDWLEDDEDLSLFAMPEIDAGNAVHQPSLTMLLASSSPMLMPLRTGSDGGPEQQR